MYLNSKKAAGKVVPAVQCGDICVLTCHEVCARDCNGNCSGWCSSEERW